jgi:hypothetical protein
MGKLKNQMIDIELEVQNRVFKRLETMRDVELLASSVNPAVGLLEGREWIPANNTDVTRTWRRFGWRPIAEIIAEGKEINKK